MMLYDGDRNRSQGHVNALLRAYVEAIPYTRYKSKIKIEEIKEILGRGLCSSYTSRFFADFLVDYTYRLHHIERLLREDDHIDRVLARIARATKPLIKLLAHHPLDLQAYFDDEAKLTEIRDNYEQIIQTTRYRFYNFHRTIIDKHIRLCLAEHFKETRAMPSFAEILSLQVLLRQLTNDFVFMQSPFHFIANQNQQELAKIIDISDPNFLYRFDLQYATTRLCSSDGFQAVLNELSPCLQAGNVVRLSSPVHTIGIAINSNHEILCRNSSDPDWIINIPDLSTGSWPIIRALFTTPEGLFVRSDLYLIRVQVFNTQAIARVALAEAKTDAKEIVENSISPNAATAAASASATTSPQSAVSEEKGKSVSDEHDIDVFDSSRTQPLFPNRVEHITSLIHHPRGPLINVRTFDSYSYLMMVTWNNETDIVRMLLSMVDETGRPWANIGLTDAKGRNAFMLACCYGSVETLKCFLSRTDLDINYTDQKGNSALIHAVVFRRVDIIAELFKDPRLNYNLPNSSGMTALKAAKYLGYSDMVVLLNELIHQRKQHDWHGEGIPSLPPIVVNTSLEDSPRDTYTLLFDRISVRTGTIAEMPYREIEYEDDNRARRGSVSRSSVTEVSEVKPAEHPVNAEEVELEVVDGTERDHQAALSGKH